MQYRLLKRPVIIFCGMEKAELLFENRFVFKDTDNHGRRNRGQKGYLPLFFTNL